MSGTPTLSTPGCVLRPLGVADAPALFVALSDADVQKFRRAEAHKDIDETARYIEDTLARGYGWCVTEAGGEALGRLALRLLPDGVGEIGIVLRGSAQRRGLGLKALTLVERFAFSTLRLGRLRAAVDAENEPSLALFARAGFKDEARESAESHRRQRDNVILVKANDARTSAPS